MPTFFANGFIENTYLTIYYLINVKQTISVSKKHNRLLISRSGKLYRILYECLKMFRSSKVDSELYYFKCLRSVTLEYIPIFPLGLLYGSGNCAIPKFYPQINIKRQSYVQKKVSK